MLIFFDHRLAFLATPKAGSTAVEAALEPLASVAVQRPAAMKHVDIRCFDAHVRPWLRAASDGADFTTVALMREPIDWLRSWYRFRQRDDAEDLEHALAGMSFDDFAKAWLDGTASGAAGVGRQTDYLTSPNGGRVDHIFRYEDIQRFTHFLEDSLNFAINLPRVNVPPSADVTLSPATEARLREALASDLAFYAAL